jgi:hypothetical protein
MAQKVIYEVEEIGKVINYMRTEKNIINITEASGIYTIYSDSLILLRENENIYLQAGQIITINSEDYKVLTVNLNTKTFTITKDVALFHMSGQNKVLDATKWKLTVNYLYGSRIEINSIIQNIGKGSDKLATKFPLIWMFVNNKEEINPRENIDISTNSKFALVHNTDKNYKASDRLTNVFKPILDPLWLLFKKTMESTYFSSVFNFQTYEYPYEKYYRYFYGSSDKNEGVLDSPTDAIEIGLDLEFRKQY